tara:strand:+ start:23 stop:562 length:540 start_codon:yes stop_codon:yes gene_type:complete
MKVSLNLTKLKGNKLTPSEFTYLLLKSEHTKQLDKYLEILPIDREKLEKRGFVKIMPDDSLTLRQKALDLFTLRGCEDCWSQFVVAYPRKDQGRPLHNDMKRNKLKYISLIEKNPDLHDVIIKSLDAEKEDRKRASWSGEFRPRWKMMSSYLNQEAWTMYEGSEILTKSDEKEYGGDLV